MRQYDGSFQNKIITRVFLTIVVPAFLLLVAFYAAWNAYVRARMVQDVAHSTAAAAERIESDMAAYDDLLGSLGKDPALGAAFLGESAETEAVFRRIYSVIRERRVAAVVRGVGADGRRVFSTFGYPDAGEEADPEWGFFGIMNGAPGEVTGYRRSLRFGGTRLTEYSLGVPVLGADGDAVGYIMADLSFRGSQDPLSEKGNGVTSAFVLTDGFDRIVVSDAEGVGDEFGKFSIPGGGGETRIGGARYAYARVELPRHRLRAYGLASMEFILSSFRFGLSTISVIIALFTAVFALILRRSVKRLTRPIREILAVMREVSRGDFSARLEVKIRGRA
jgi:hypothetical protein